jgi:N-acetylglucosaminyldiphosphoundecaprenol N-acetyl-beta-D-mannosaminyltransferase
MEPQRISPAVTLDLEPADQQSPTRLSHPASGAAAPRQTVTPYVRVGGLPIIALSRQAWTAKIVATCLRRRVRRGQQPVFLTSANGNVLSRYATNPQFRELLDQADGIDADGQPLVVASRLLTRTPIPERCATTDLFHDLADAGSAHGIRYYLLGGKEAINAAAATAATDRHAGLVIAGRHHGYFTSEAETQLVAEINAAAPDILWVGLGVPYEQAFVVRNRARLTSVGVIKTCGGLFDFVAGKNTRAPQWMQDAALEWLYRLYLEPRRLFWRYAITNVHTTWLLALKTRDMPGPHKTW